MKMEGEARGDKDSAGGGGGDKRKQFEDRGR